MTNGGLAQVHVTVGPVGSLTHSMVNFPVLEYITGTDRLSSWQICTLVSCLCSEGHCGENGLVEVTGTASTQGYFLGGYYRDQSHNRGLERCRTGESYYIPGQVSHLASVEDK